MCTTKQQVFDVLVLSLSLVVVTTNMSTEYPSFVDDRASTGKKEGTVMTSRNSNFKFLSTSICSTSGL